MRRTIRLILLLGSLLAAFIGLCVAAQDRDIYTGIAAVIVGGAGYGVFSGGRWIVRRTV